MGAFIEHFENGRKADRHNLYVPREDVQLFLAVAVYFASPITAVLIWMTMVTNRRISEALRLRACDIHVSGSPSCDKPHVWFGEREGEEEYPGMGKLGGDEIYAKLPIESVAMMRSILDSGVPWELLPALVPYQSSHPDVFKKYKPFSKAAFTPAKGSDLMFPALKKSDTPWLSRQTAWNTIDRTRTVMFDLTGRRRYNPSKKFNGMHVTVHGATRHTSASLLLYNPDAKMPPPSEATILEVQQRSDADTFRRHYHHPHDVAVEQAMSYAWVEPPFRPKPAPPPTLTGTTPTTAMESAAPSLAGDAAENKPAQVLDQMPPPTSPTRNAWRKRQRKMGLERALVELSSEERTSRNLLIDGCPSAAGHDVNNQTNSSFPAPH